MTTIIIPHFLSSPRFLGRPRLLTRISRLPTGRHGSAVQHRFLQRNPITYLVNPKWEAWNH